MRLLGYFVTAFTTVTSEEVGELLAEGSGANEVDIAGSGDDLPTASLVQEPIPSVTACNTNDGQAAIHAEVKHLTSGLGEGWTLGEDSDSLTRIFWPEDVAVNSTVEERDGGQFLVLTTDTFGSDLCKGIMIGGEKVCADADNGFKFRCSYPLADQSISQEFKILGDDSDNTVEEETTEKGGTLNYALTVDTNVTIGEPVVFTITPASEGLVYATVKNCDITVPDNVVQSLRIFGIGKDMCTLSVIGGQFIGEYGASSNGVIQAQWNAFKRVTGGHAINFEEVQTLQCNIALSDKRVEDAIVDCDV